MDKSKYDINNVVEFLGGEIEEEVVASLVGMFVSSINEEFPLFAEAVVSDNRPTIHSIGHKLKGSSASLGFEDFRKLCEDLEQHARKDLDFDYKSTFNKLCSEKQAIVEWFNSIKDNYGL